MAVSRLRLACLLCWVFASSAGAADQTEADRVLEFVKERLARQTAVLGERIEYCTSVRAKAPVPSLSLRKLEELGASRKDVLHAVSYLSLRNFSRCEGNARYAQAYALGLLAATQTHYGIDSTTTNEISAGLVYPSPAEIQSQLSYEDLSAELRSYLESAIGESPFLLPQALKKNGLVEVR